MAQKQKRLTKEIKDCKLDQELTGISATPVGDSLEHLKGTLKGPKDTPYEKGVFTVDIKIPATSFSALRANLRFLLDPRAAQAVMSSSKSNVKGAVRLCSEKRTMQSRPAMLDFSRRYRYTIIAQCDVPPFSS